MYDIIGKHLRDEASATEIHHLEDWRSENQYNESLFNTLSNIWTRYGTLPQMKDVDVDVAWQHQLSLKNQDTPTLNIRHWLSIAAAIALMIVSYFAFQFTQPMYQSGDEMLAVGLPDNSDVWLNHSSSMNYELKDEVRQVTMEGEAFFDVYKDATQPFIIDNAALKIAVVGTSFNVKYRAGYSEIAVFTGIVKVGDDHDSKTLTKGMAVRYDHDNKELSVMDFSPNAIAWKTGVLQFTNTPIADAIVELESHYQTGLRLENVGATARVTARFEHQDLEEVLLTLETITGETIHQITND